MTRYSEQYDALNEKREWHLILAVSLAVIGGVTWVGFTADQGRIISLLMFAGGGYYFVLATLLFARKQNAFFKDLETSNLGEMSTWQDPMRNSGFIEKMPTRSILLVLAVVAILLAVALISFLR